MYLCTRNHLKLTRGERCPCGAMADSVTANVIHYPRAVALDVSGVFYGYRPGLYGVERAPVDWWRCDACGHAVAFREKGELQVACPHCGAAMPARYDPQQEGGR